MVLLSDIHDMHHTHSNQTISTFQLTHISSYNIITTRLTFISAIAQFLSQIYGMDSVIINQLMYGIRGINGEFTKSGYVKNMETQERWGWHKELLDSFEYTSLVDWLLKKIGEFLVCC